MTLIERSKNVLTNPVNVWDSIKAETATVKGIIIPFALILAAIPAAANLLGFLVSGTFSWFVGPALVSTILYYALYVFAPLLIALVISLLAPSFGGKKDLVKACQLSYYSYIPAYLGGLFILFSYTSMSGIAIIGSLCGLYALVLLFFGAKKMLDVPQEKYIPLIVISLVVCAAIFFLGGILIKSITENMMVSSMMGALGNIF